MAPAVTPEVNSDLWDPGVGGKLKSMIEGGLSMCAYVQQGGDTKKALDTLKLLARQQEFERGKLLKNAGGNLHQTDRCEL